MSPDDPLSLARYGQPTPIPIRRNDTRLSNGSQAAVMQPTSHGLADSFEQFALFLQTPAAFPPLNLVTVSLTSSREHGALSIGELASAV